MSSSFTDLDLARLEEHWVEQTPLMKAATRKAAIWKKKHADAEARQTVIEAEVKRRIRKDPKKYGIARVSEPAIKEAMIVHPKYQEAVKEVNRCKYNRDIVEGLVTTLEHRKRSLENLVTLYGQDYFAKPSSKKAGPDFQRKIQEDSAHRSFRRKRKKK